MVGQRLKKRKRTFENDYCLVARTVHTVQCTVYRVADPDLSDTDKELLTGSGSNPTFSVL